MIWVDKDKQLPDKYNTVLVITTDQEYITAMYNGNCFKSIETFKPVSVVKWRYFTFPDGSGRDVVTDMREDVIHACVMEWIENHNVYELFHVLTDCNNCPVIDCYPEAEGEAVLSCPELLENLELDTATIAKFNSKYMSELDDISLYCMTTLCDDCVCYNNCDSTIPCYDNVERWVRNWNTD